MAATPSPQPDTKAIVVRDLTRRFGSFTAVDRVNFEVEQGEIFGFLGANGAPGDLRNARMARQSGFTPL